MKVSKAQIEYIENKLRIIVNEKRKALDKKYVEELYEWLQKNPLKLKKKFDTCFGLSDYVDNYLDKKAYNIKLQELRDKLRKELKVFEDKKTEILDSYILSGTDVLESIKQLQEM
jgi:hypothetical protein